MRTGSQPPAYLPGRSNKLTLFSLKCSSLGCSSNTGREMSDSHTALSDNCLFMCDQQLYAVLAMFTLTGTLSFP